MTSPKWKSWEELNNVLKEGKRVVFWGASNWIQRTLGQLTLPDGAYIVDKSALNHGIDYCGFEVKPPEVLKKEDPSKVYVIITTANYASAIEELEKMGFVAGKQYCCTPLLNERKAKDDLKSHRVRVLVSSPQHWSNNSQGGGLYQCDIGTGEVVKLYAGKCRSIARNHQATYVVDMLRGIIVFDRDFKEVGHVKVEKNSEPHGLAVDETNGLLFVGQAGRDSIGVYSLETEKSVDEIFMSEKWHLNKKDNHHINDLCIYNNSLYVAMFSFSGNWPADVFDGGVLEINIAKRKVLGPVVHDLWMPHSVMIKEGKLAYIDSMRGVLYEGNRCRMGHFYGFVRGLDYDGKYYYVGVTEHRYPERLKGIVDHISLSAGFFVFDPSSKMARFFSLPQMEAVHSVVVV